MKFRLKWCFHGNIAYFFFTVTFFFNIDEGSGWEGKMLRGAGAGEGGMLDFERNKQYFV